MKQLLSNSNTKLGKLSSFSLPLCSCDKRYNKLCRKYCYAKYMYRMYPSYRKKMLYNYRIAKNTDKFFERMLHELKEATSKVRLHVSGDFFSQEYVDAWISIAKFYPDQKFYCYTKAIGFDYSQRPSNLIIYLSDDQRKLKRHYHRFDGVTTISFDKKPINGFSLCRHQSEGIRCAFCGLCMQKGNKIYFNRH